MKKSQVNIAVRGREGREMTITFRDCLCFILLSSRSYSPLVALTVSLKRPSKKGKDIFPEGEPQVNNSCGLICLYCSHPFVSAPIPLSLTRVTGLFFRNSFQPWWIYQAPTAFDLGFWCCLPLLTSTLGAALHHIDFSEDETLIEQTSLGGRGDPTHVLHRYRLWKRTRPARPTGKRREANEPVHLILRDLNLNMSLLCKISSISVPLSLTPRCQDEGYRKVAFN